MAGLLPKVSVRWQPPGPKRQALRHWPLKAELLELLELLRLGLRLGPRLGLLARAQKVRTAKPERLGQLKEQPLVLQPELKPKLPVLPVPRP